MVNIDWFIGVTASLPHPFGIKTWNHPKSWFRRLAWRSYWSLYPYHTTPTATLVVLLVSPCMHSRDSRLREDTSSTRGRLGSRILDPPPPSAGWIITHLTILIILAGLASLIEDARWRPDPKEIQQPSVWSHEYNYVTRWEMQSYFDHQRRALRNSSCWTEMKDEFKIKI